MEITIKKTVKVSEIFKLKHLKVVRTNNRDIDSTNLEIYYNSMEIGSGHINNRTNFAHITLNEDNQELEDFLVEGIENRTLEIL